MTDNNTTQEVIMNEVAAVVKNIVETKFISSGFVIQMTIINQLKIAGISGTMENISKIEEMIGD